MSITRPILIASGASIFTVATAAIAVGFHEKTKALTRENNVLKNDIEHHKRLISQSLHDNDILRATNMELQRRNDAALKVSSLVTIGAILSITSAGIVTIIKGSGRV